MRSMSATEVPPNFMTRRGMAVARCSGKSRGAMRSIVKRLREKTRIHTGAAERPQRRHWRRSMTPTSRSPSTVDPAEVERFSTLAAQWWDSHGSMAMLHKFNPVRLGFVKESVCRRFGRDGKRLDALTGLRILDIGCGGGILSEPLARLGA